MKSYLLLFAVAALCGTGCQTYQYRVVQPSGVAQVVAKATIGIRYDPLDYRLTRHDEHLAMRIINPTDDHVLLVGERSFIVDPQGESHPLRGRPIGPHSYAWLLLPPARRTYAYPYYGWGPGWGPGWGYGMGWGWYDPFWGPYYGGGFWGPPPVSYYQIITPYDWNWTTGPVRLRLTYERNGETIEHNFEIVREKEK